MIKSGNIIVLIWLLSNGIYAQKLPFQNFGVDKGLIQSQVLCIAQDNQRHLLLGTFAGLDRFDGSSFKHFTKAEGFNSSAVTCLYTAKNGYVWTGTFKGISCYDGFRVTNYLVQDKSSSFNFSTIAEDEAGTIWAFNFKKGLYVFQNNQFDKAKLPFVGAIPTCLYQNLKGQLMVNFYRKGVFVYENNSWNKFFETPFSDVNEFIIALNNNDKVYYAFTNNKKLLKFSGSTLIAEKEIDAIAVTASCVDNKGDIWMGTNKGVSIFSGEDLSHKATYTAVSGLSDNLTSCIYKDVEGNIWIGTDGDGIFKFSGGVFAKYDKNNGLPGNIVMGVAKDTSTNIYIGTRETGLVKYNILNKEIVSVDYSSLSNAGVNCMAEDGYNNLFIGTMDSRLLRYDGKSFHEIVLDKKAKQFVNSIIADDDKTWFTTSTGCYNIKGDSINKINGIDEIAVGALPMENGETLVGSTNGIYSVSGKDAIKKIAVPQLQNAEVRCLNHFHDFILVGTADDGIYFWNKQSGKIYKCDSKNGLCDNQVFSIFIDSRENIWVGTGTGVNQVLFNEKGFSFLVKKFSKEDGYENSESNLNAITEDKDGHIWIGTTKGAFVFNHDASAKNNIRPYIVIQKVESPGFAVDSLRENKISSWYHLPVAPILPYGNTNISFTVKGIFLKDPESVRYSYKLIGYDTGFSRPVNQAFFNYQSLEPGNYTFIVKAYAEDGLQSENSAEYSFSVSTPFHKTKWFLFLITGALILTGAMVQFLFTKARLRKQKQLDLYRQEEQQKIRQRTSEDFHDELGNKLTRISLLADILQKKVGEIDTEKNSIIQQIRENVQALYGGTKDIIWSLSSGSDNLVEILKRIEHFGEELFHDSNIDFVFKGLEEVNPNIILPIDYSRNMIMIFKELLNNSLRHAQCSKVIIVIANNGNDEILITQQDNGKGFDQNNVQKGNGLNNIQRRALRIGSTLKIEAKENEGMKIFLSIKIPSNGG